MWAAKFLSSNDNAEQEQFLQWVAVCMFQQLKYGKHIPVATTLETVIDDSNSIDVNSSFYVVQNVDTHTLVVAKLVKRMMFGV